VPSRFEEGTVYLTADGHRSNDFESHIFVSKDFGQTWQSAVANLKGESVKTLTEDQKNPDVLYIGTETGLFVSLDRAKSWRRIKANLPTVRIDEITLHPRDNAMVLATHGRTIWILDHLEPIQEYAAAQAAATDAKLFTSPPSSMYRRPARDRNYEFWGDHTFYGENPPQAAVISWLNKKQLGQVSLKVTDAAGREVRELSGAAFANSNKPGIQSACWDLRVQPAPAPPPQEGRGRGRGERGQAAEGGGRGQAQESPYGAACPPLQTAGGGGGFGGGGAQLGGPYVIGGVYTVSLVVDGKTVDSKPLRVADDPEVVLTSADRKRQYDMAMEMHTLQPRVTEAGIAFGSLNRQVAELTTTAASRSDVPADVKGQLEAFKKELDGLAPRLAIPQGGRGGGGGGRGNNESLTGKVGQAKNGFMSGMVVGEQTLRAYTEVKSQAPKTIADLNAAIAKATTLSATLARYNLTLTVPQPVKAIEAAPARKATGAPKQ
jgi:sortilin (neurotensin receptor 3)